MSDSKSQDHWKDLAHLLGAEIPEEPEEEPAAEPVVSETETPSERADQSVGEGHESELPQRDGDEGPTPVESTETAAQPPRPQPPAPKADANHWRGLAGALGIDVPDEEFEESSETVDETDEVRVDEVVIAAEVPPAPLSEEPVAEEEELEPAAEVEPLEPSPSVDELERPVERPTRYVPSLFDDESFDVPGALDRIFEQEISEQQTVPAEPAGFEDRDEFLDLGGGFKDDEADEDEDTEEADEPVGAAERDSVESEAEEPRRRRKRRRRRRKGAKKDAAASSEDEKADDADTDLIDEDSTSERDDETSDHEDEEDEPSTLGVKHRKIPTWEEAVGVVISANSEARAKNPGGGARGRGRGRGRRS